MTDTEQSDSVAAINASMHERISVWLADDGAAVDLYVTNSMLEKEGAGRATVRLTPRNAERLAAELRRFAARCRS